MGDQVDEGDTVVILESMKMEMPVEAEDAGTVKEINCEEGQSVRRATSWSSSNDRRPAPSLGGGRRRASPGAES